jgi:hypothetical protein
MHSPVTITLQRAPQGKGRARSLIKRRSAENLIERLPAARVNLSPRSVQSPTKK